MQPVNDGFLNPVQNLQMIPKMRSKVTVLFPNFDLEVVVEIDYMKGPIRIH